MSRFALRISKSINKFLGRIFLREMAFHRYGEDDDPKLIGCQYTIYQTRGGGAYAVFWESPDGGYRIATAPTWEFVRESIEEYASEQIKL
jgi:hypothetical protein